MRNGGELKRICSIYFQKLEDKYIVLKPRQMEGDYLNPNHLAWMLITIPTLETYGKASRWLGYVQGVLACQGLINVDQERSRTRPMFSEMDKRGEA